MTVPVCPPRSAPNCSAARNPGTGSSGIGLSIARELAEQNGGVLQLAESARGTTFVLELPASTPWPAEHGALRSLG